MNARRRAAAAVLAGLLAGVAVLATASVPVVLRPDTAPWRRIVRGATIDGVVPEAAVIVLPGLDRGTALEVRVSAEGAAGGLANLAVALDGGPRQWLRTRGAVPALIIAPARPIPGLRLDLEPAPA